MNLAIEYLIRSGAAQRLFETPCSLYIVGRHDADKIAVTIDKGFLVRHWLLSLCNEEHVLPPMSEYRVNDVFESEAVVKPDYCLLEFQEDPIPSSKNSYREPMAGETYSLYTDRFPISAKHEMAKNCWLWRSFRRTFLTDVDLPCTGEWCGMGFRVSKSPEEIVEDQQEYVSKHLPRYWKYWQMWLKYMLPVSKAPGELVFSGSYLLR